MVLRILMLVGLVWITKLDVELFTFARHHYTIKDLVLIGGGLFLLFKGTTEIHDSIEGHAEETSAAPAGRRGLCRCHRPDRLHQHHLLAG